MELKEIEAFYYAATMKSFARAAERLETSQPTISARVASLERGLNVKLFDRSHRTARLTARGREMLERAERMLTLVRETRAIVADRASFRGTLRLGSAETLVHTWLPRFMQKLRGSFPRLDLELTVDITPHLRAGLEANDLDLAFLMGPVTQPGFRNLALAAYRTVFVAAPSLGLPRRRLSARTLAQYPLITYPRNTVPTTELAALIRRHAGRSPRLVASGALAANVRLAVTGAGVALLPEALVKAELKSGELVEVKTAIAPTPLAFTATWFERDAEPHLAAVAELAQQVARAKDQKS
ncbi:MAG TPA: LysR family transcriptional regulator [Casimicrobiaceae bacterium]|nr:LysR family transcriptional regulator [Casimicrobiaceae bacterium]